MPARENREAGEKPARTRRCNQVSHSSVSHWAQSTGKAAGLSTTWKPEGLPATFIRDGVAAGNIVIIKSAAGPDYAVGIGQSLRTKVNASIGTSSDIIDLEMELKKARVAQSCGADTLMELSTAGYFELVAKQAQGGIGFMAIHCGVNSLTVDVLKSQGRRNGGLVSRGGAFMISWMNHQEAENPLYSRFDHLLEILRKFDVVLSLGNGMRAGAGADSTDRAQIQELLTNIALADIAHEAGIQTMLEGPGHIPIDECDGCTDCGSCG